MNATSNAGIADSENLDAGYPHPLRAWYAVLLLLLAFAISFVDRQILSLLVEPIRADLGLSDTAISLLHGFAFVILYTFMGVLLGRWADRGHRQTMIIIGMVTWSLATIACGFSDTFEELFIARIFVGVGEATLSPAAYSMISDYFPKARRNRAIGVYTTGVFIGASAALIFGGMAVSVATSGGTGALPILASLKPWQSTFVLVGLPGLLVAILMLTVREPARKERSEDSMRAANTVNFLKAHWRLLLTIMIGFSFASLSAFGIAAWAPTYFLRVFGWSIGQFAASFGIVGLCAGCLGVVTAGWLADRAIARGRPDGIVKVAWIAMLAAAPALMLAGLAHNPYLAVAAFGWATFCQAMPSCLAPASLNVIAPNEYRGQVIGLYLFCASFIGMGGGATLVALATDHVFQDDMAVGKSMALVLSLAALTSAALLSLAQRRFARHAAAPVAV